MTRGISDPVPVEEPKEPAEQPQGDGPTNKDILDYLDELSDFIREIDIRLATIERFAIPEMTPAKEAPQKNFLTGK